MSSRSLSEPPFQSTERKNSADFFFFFIEMLRSVKLVQGLEATASRCSLSTELWLIYIYLFRNFSPSHRYRHSTVHHFSLPLLFLPQAGEVFLASWWGRFRIHGSRHQATRDRWLRWRNQRSGAECDWFHIESAAERPRHGWSGEIDTEQRCLVVTWAGLVCWDRWDWKHKRFLKPQGCHVAKASMLKS